MRYSLIFLGAAGLAVAAPMDPSMASDSKYAQYIPYGKYDPYSHYSGYPKAVDEAAAKMGTVDTNAERDSIIAMGDAEDAKHVLRAKYDARDSYDSYDAPNTKRHSMMPAKVGMNKEGMTSDERKREMTHEPSEEEMHREKKDGLLPDAWYGGYSPYVGYGSYRPPWNKHAGDSVEEEK